MQELWPGQARLRLLNQSIPLLTPIIERLRIQHPEAAAQVAQAQAELGIERYELHRRRDRAMEAIRAEMRERIRRRFSLTRLQKRQLRLMERARDFRLFKREITLRATARPAPTRLPRRAAPRRRRTARRALSARAGPRGADADPAEPPRLSALAPFVIGYRHPHGYWEFVAVSEPYGNGFLEPCEGNA